MRAREPGGAQPPWPPGAFGPETRVFEGFRGHRGGVVVLGGFLGTFWDPLSANRAYGPKSYFGQKPHFQLAHGGLLVS